jgi:hypothetical protein
MPDVEHDITLYIIEEGKIKDAYKIEVEHGVDPRLLGKVYFAYYTNDVGIYLSSEGPHVEARPEYKHELYNEIGILRIQKKIYRNIDYLCWYLDRCDVNEMHDFKDSESTCNFDPSVFEKDCLCWYDWGLIDPSDDRSGTINEGKTVGILVGWDNNKESELNDSDIKRSMCCTGCEKRISLKNRCKECIKHKIYDTFKEKYYCEECCEGHCYFCGLNEGESFGRFLELCSTSGCENITHVDSKCMNPSYVCQKCSNVYCGTCAKKEDSEGCNYDDTYFCKKCYGEIGICCSCEATITDQTKCQKCIDQGNYDSDDKYCKECCGGHCSACDSSESSRYSDDVLYECESEDCENLTHVKFFACEDSGYTCKICEKKYCLQCSKDKSKDGYSKFRTFCKKCMLSMAKKKEKKLIILNLNTLRFYKTLNPRYCVRFYSCWIPVCKCCCYS